MDPSPNTRRLLDAAKAIATRNGQVQLGLHHLLIALLDDYRGMVEDFIAGLDFHARRNELEEQVRSGEVGREIAAEELLESAAERSRERGRDAIHIRDFAWVVLERAGWEPSESAPASTSASAPGNKTEWVGARPTLPTPTLNRCARDLTAESADRTPVIGRAEEVEQVLQTLCRTQTRNPLLLGPAGVGKTAIVDELARRIGKGEVPSALQGCRIFQLDKASLLGGTHNLSELQERIKALIAEASQPGVILFIDEVHHLLGGDAALGSEFANTFKPALARGELACIAATTDGEYRTSIQGDPALSRRFQPIRVQQLGQAETLEILTMKAGQLAKDFSIQLDEGVLPFLVGFARDNMPNRCFPEKALVLLDQCVSAVRMADGTSLTRGGAEKVVTSMLGLPGSLSERLLKLGESLRRQALLDEAQLEHLIDRLQVTGENLDLHPQQPQAVVLLAGPGRVFTDSLAGTLARDFAGAAERILPLPLHGMVHDASIRELLGAPPSYVGYGAPVAIHALAQMPSCVVVCQGLDQCHPTIAHTVIRAIRDGWFTDARGEKLYLSNAVVLVTIATTPEHDSGLGFGATDDSAAEGSVPPLEEWLPRDLLPLAPMVDVVVASAPDRGAGDEAWLRTEVLPALDRTYEARGLTLRWEARAMDLLLTRAAQLQDRNRLTRWVEETVATVLIPHIRENDGALVATLDARGDTLCASTTHPDS